MKLVRIRMDIVASFPDDAPEEDGLVLHSANHARILVEGARVALRKLGAVAILGGPETTFSLPTKKQAEDAHIAAETAWSTP